MPDAAPQKDISVIEPSVKDYFDRSIEQISPALKRRHNYEFYLGVTAHKLMIKQLGKLKEYRGYKIKVMQDDNKGNHDVIIFS